MNIEEFEEIEELIAWNMSFNISKTETLRDIGKLEFINLF